MTRETAGHERARSAFTRRRSQVRGLQRPRESPGERHARPPNRSSRSSRPRTIPESSGGDVRGSIRTKVPGKVYELRVALGKDPVTGRYRQKSITVRGSRADAQRALRRLLDDVETGGHQRPDGGSRTFGELLDDWLGFKIAADRSPTTIDRYRGVIERQLKPTLGAVTLDQLETRTFDDLYRA